MGTDLQCGQPRDRSSIEFSFQFKVSRGDLQPTGPPTQWALATIKQPGRQAVQSLPFRAKVNNTGNVRITHCRGALVQPLLQWKGNKYYTFWVCNCNRTYHAVLMTRPCLSHAVPLPCRALIHTRHAASLPCSDSAVFFVNVRMVAGNIRLLVQQCNRSSFL